MCWGKRWCGSLEAPRYTLCVVQHTILYMTVTCDRVIVLSRLHVSFSYLKYLDNELISLKQDLPYNAKGVEFLRGIAVKWLRQESGFVRSKNDFVQWDTSCECTRCSSAVSCALHLVLLLPTLGAAAGGVWLDCEQCNLQAVLFVFPLDSHLLVARCCWDKESPSCLGEQHDLRCMLCIS